MTADETSKSEAARRARAANLRTALVFASIALVFFCGIIATKWMGGPVTGISVMGVAVLVFLLFAIGRSLRK
jgi:K+-sensing histidine kinase KdpD